MSKIAILTAIVLFFSFNIFSIPKIEIKADEIDEITQELENLKRNLEESRKATKPLEENLKRIENELYNIKKKLTKIELAIKKREEDIKASEQDLIMQKKILDIRIKEHYKNIKKSQLSLINLFASANFSKSLQNFIYQKKAADKDKQLIFQILFRIKKNEDEKKSLAQENLRLKETKSQFDKQSKFLTQEIGNAKKYQSELSTKIAQLSARQKELLAKKLASLNIPRSAAFLGGCSDDRNIDPGFSPRFAFFTYGVPNRVGMNQYGARGRALAGQNEEEILRAYYDNFELKKDYDTNITISVEGYGQFNIEDYVKRIYEVPNGWPMAALKAQAIAARTYALAYTNNGNRPICATQQCQVFKPDPKGGPWEQAVNETKGWVMVQNGSPIKSWYSSTHGGYILSSGEIGWSPTSWTKHAVDTTSGTAGSFDDLHNNAYDKDSPWFYCDWGSRQEYNKTAWLKSEEVADIANVILLAKKDSSLVEHFYQTDKPNPAGIETWGPDRIKSELSARGESFFNNVENISVAVDFNAGRTTSIVINGSGISRTFDAKEFKDWFNLRAPSNIQIVGPLYNVEKR